MEDWDMDELWAEDDDLPPDYLDFAVALSELFFLSDNDLYPNDEDYRIEFLPPEDWVPLVRQLDGMVNWTAIVVQAEALEPLLELPGLPTELLEAPLDFLESVLDGELPRPASGKRIGSRRLVKIARWVVGLAQGLPDLARAAAQAWANVHRARRFPFGDEYYDDEDLAELLLSDDLPPAVAGFGMLIAMTLSRWPERGEGVPLPSRFSGADAYEDMLAEWEALPDSPSVTAEGFGDAEALFSQGQLAHTLARMGSIQGLDPEDTGEGDVALAYSRLSRAILWVHHQCRRCPERDGVACKVAETSWSDRPVPLLDVAAEIANAGRIENCIRM